MIGETVKQFGFWMPAMAGHFENEAHVGLAGQQLLHDDELPRVIPCCSGISKVLSTRASSRGRNTAVVRGGEAGEPDPRQCRRPCIAKPPPPVRSGP